MTNHIHAKRSLGQNWLVNEGVLDRIVAAAGVSKSDTVLEIGPGKGALTRRLAATGARIVAVEKDSRLVPVLQEQFASVSNVQIIEGDALTLDPTSYLLTPNSYTIVANLPYYITSHALRLMLDSWPPPTRAILMVQDEVADRLMAQPPHMNLLALSVQLAAQPRLIMRVSRGSFRPIPDVDSAVIVLELEKQSAELKGQNSDILRVAKRAFGQKRKQLKATLPSELLTRTGIAPTIRPQELSVSQWRALARNSTFHLL